MTDSEFTQRARRIAAQVESLARGAVAEADELRDALCEACDTLGAQLDQRVLNHDMTVADAAPLRARCEELRKLYTDEGKYAPRVRACDPRTTDYCVECGESPDSGSHLHGHEYVDPRPGPSRPTFREMTNRMIRRHAELLGELGEGQSPLARRPPPVVQTTPMYRENSGRRAADFDIDPTKIKPVPIPSAGPGAPWYKHADDCRCEMCKVHA